VKFLRYAIIGGLCMLLNLAVLWLLTSVAGLHYLVSTMISFFTLTPVGFVLQKAVTFRTPRAAAPVEWPRYLVTMAASFAANLGLMYLLVSLLGVWYLAASVIVALLLLATNFLVNNHWSFALRR
jgi:putative flippase GtrA